jgi:hypothetical protein
MDGRIKFETEPLANCGARTRAGGMCRNRPIQGKKRCRMHGGKSSGPTVPHRPFDNTRAIKHGVYASRLLPGEVEWVPILRDQLGSLDDEAVLARILLLRALNALTTNAEHVGMFVIADRLLGRIVRIEEAREGLKLEELEGLKHRLAEAIQRVEKQLAKGTDEYTLVTDSDRK